MSEALQSLIACGTKLWLDSIDPDLVASNRAWGASGATSNPVIISDLIKTGRFNESIAGLIREGLDDQQIAWEMTDRLVQQAQRVFQPVWESTSGNDGYVSFELDPLLEDPNQPRSLEQRIAQYIALGKLWSAGHSNRMIKVPATEAGLGSLESLAALGVTLNVTLIFTERQYEAAREAIWKGAQQRPDLQKFKSVYSIFVSRLDVYTQQHVPDLSEEAQGQVGIVNAKRIWQSNQAYWSDRATPLQQEIIFASTGTKNPADDAWKYVAALAGSDIQTNPPATNDLVDQSGMSFQRQVDQLPADSVLDEIDAKVDMEQLERVLMEEGIAKFANPQHALLKLIGEMRSG